MHIQTQRNLLLFTIKAQPSHPFPFLGSDCDGRCAAVSGGGGGSDHRQHPQPFPSFSMSLSGDTIPPFTDDRTEHHHHCEVVVQRRPNRREREREEEERERRREERES
ncbi:hypothetical protein HanRHA438_Chr02g0067401 [Helianthus annuus]|nr:hypothetical protein HanRHA438_Chr02g0067401 [Helianthus annuus]